MTPSSDEILIEAQQANQRVARSDAMQRLFSNQDFNLLFRDDYLKSRVIELVKARSLPNTDLEQNAKELDAISYLDKFISDILSDGPLAKDEYLEKSHAYEQSFIKE